ncbi:hypothetical protein Q765_07170 [Flavobacterium rivuli WB 3.3-2 = DSM 21788]|uniref:Glycosyl transferase family 1 domain-containing protein n=1 Tax=Flavobacterium rivuli WB 3.3-2 = DSM 21788 TaxID=1121895 RepID=A0A0A2M585_9FLAO|nr:glycosyltransferase family 4 protein [Flavobacterium rivuli]KGO87439.1 hypothetical protein Q765_07170 [Flavobacterium rivuli WB 3.3-2 = DSM 21788]
MKILFLSYRFYPEIGGIEVNSEILADYFSRFGAEVHMVTTSSIKDDDKRIFNYKIIRNPGRTALIKQYLWADVIFENNPSLTLSWFNLFFNKPIVIAINTWISRMDGNMTLPDKLKLLWVKKASAVIAVSNAIKEKSFDKSIVIGNPYRDDLFVDYKTDSSKDFAFLGRLVSDKGADMAINLLHKLNTDDSINKRKFTLTIIGDGPEIENLQNAVNNYNLNNYVTFAGMLKGKELVDCLNNHKYMLAPSRWREPFGNIALEGIACGCLPIVSDGGGLPDAVGNAGVVFERNSDESLFNKTKELLSNPDLEKQLRLNFQSHLKNHIPEFVAEKYFEVLKKVI